MNPSQYRRMVKHVDRHCLTVRLARTGAIRKAPARPNHFLTLAVFIGALIGWAVAVKVAGIVLTILK